MNVIEDAELLRRFAAKRVEDAFAELVRRHVNLVYSASLRQVGGDRQLAEEVTQTVFADLACKADSLSRRESLVGWLYTSAHFAAAKVVRSERRRRLREKEALHMQETHANPGSELQWEQLQPVIDDAMNELPEADREAILQRFFEKKPFLQIGAKLGLSENAARMRVDRALEKLRGFLKTRGVTSTSATLATLLGAQSVSAAPVTLTAKVVGASLAVAAGGTATAWSIFTVAKLAVPVACAVAAVVGLLVQNDTLKQLRKENATLLAGQPAAAVYEPSVVAPNDSEEVERLDREKLELLRLRSEVGRLQREVSELKAARESSAVPEQADKVESPEEIPPQIHVKAKFVIGTDDALESFLDNSTQVVAPTEMSKLLTRLSQSRNVEVLGEQSVITLSGRQAQVSAFEVRTNTSTGAVTESGHTLDVLPTLRVDGRSAMLEMAVSKMNDTPAVPNEMQRTWHPATAAQLQMKLSANAIVWDGQTVVMAGQSEGKKLVVFVTPTLIDAVGNRIHQDLEQ